MAESRQFCAVARSSWVILAIAIASTTACSGTDSGASGTSTGGESGSWAAGGTGGSSAIGGTSSTTSPSSTVTTGGANTAGTTAVTGGAKASGGTSSTGGTKATGGTAATTGGTKATGGAPSTGGTKGTGGSSGTGGASNCKCLGSGPPTGCTGTGHVTFSLSQVASPTATEQAAYDLITCAMDMAVAYYNCYTNITKTLNVSYNTGVATADGNYNGSIRFGGTSYMECATAMHEIGHTVGIGTVSQWATHVVNGLFAGTNTAQQLQTINAGLTTPLDTAIHADTQHFWPYGLNYASEATSTSILVDHCLIVVAIRKDLGL